MFDDDLTEKKWYIWGRHILAWVEEYEDKGFSDETIQIYLRQCADLREEYLDPNDLTEYEEIYTEKIQKYFKKYGVIDPIYEAIYN